MVDFITKEGGEAPLWSLGLMSGTSLDALDMAMVQTDGQRIMAHGAEASVPFPEALQQALYGLMQGNGDNVAIEHAYSRFVAESVAQFLHTYPTPRPTIIGFHGQTITHRPEAGITWQLGNPALLVEAVRIPVIYDFRRRDMAAGGQGAPLVPLYHAALAHGLPTPLVIVNIGGVANITYIAQDRTIYAWDTGTGNALLNDWVMHHTGEAYDAQGAYAGAGNVAWERVERAMQHPYFAALPPKSLDRNSFDINMAEGLSLEDGAATFTAFTIEAIAASMQHMPCAPLQWIVCGGGAHNHTMMRMLQQRCNAPITQATQLGWRGDALEAEAFAFLAVRSLYGLPLSLPTTTGATRAVTGGVLCQ